MVYFPMGARGGDATHLFPLDCRRRLGGDVVDYAVDAAHAVGGSSFQY